MWVLTNKKYRIWFDLCLEIITNCFYTSIDIECSIKLITLQSGSTCEVRGYGVLGIESGCLRLYHNASVPLVPSWEECSSWCAETKECGIWSYKPKTGNCQLRHSYCINKTEETQTKMIGYPGCGPGKI